jgi:hypothetical protein
MLVDLRLEMHRIILAAAGLTHTAGAAVWHGLVVAKRKSFVHRIKFQP